LSVEQLPGLLSRPRDRALLVLIASLAVAICVPGLRTLSFLWSGNEFYAHAFILPVVAGFLLYGERARLARAFGSPEPPSWGPVLVAGAGLFEVAMLMGDVGFGVGLGIPLVLGATAYASGGMRLLRPMALPLCFLALAVPPPRFVVYELLVRLKLVVTTMAVGLLQELGFTVLAEGNRILIPGHTLFVADACTGLTSLVTLLPLSCVVAHFLGRGIWRRVAIVASVVPLALGANVLRVSATVSLVARYGSDLAQGLLHESFGLASSVLGTLALIGFARAIR